MLLKEIYGIDYSKTEHRNRLLMQLANRSDASVERKHQNMSAVLLRHGLPYIDGYKPLGNYQELLAAETLAYLAAEPSIATTLVCAPRLRPCCLEKDWDAADIRSLRDNCPNAHDPAEKRAAPLNDGTLPNIARMQASDETLQCLGMQFAMHVERQTLADSGRRDLADRVQIVSPRGGNGSPYDVASFRIEDGEEVWISVKTTALGKYFPFFVTHSNVSLSQEQPDRFRLYRVFSCGWKTRFYAMEGDLSVNCPLVPWDYMAPV